VAVEGWLTTAATTAGEAFKTAVFMDSGGASTAGERPYSLQTPLIAGPSGSCAKKAQWCAPRRRQQAGTSGLSFARSPGATGENPKIIANKYAQTRRTE